MGTHFYKFNRSNLGNLIFQGKYLMKYFDIQEYGTLFKDTEIENAKDNFLVDKKRTVKSGKSWLKNHLKNK